MECALTEEEIAAATKALILLRDRLTEFEESLMKPNSLLISRRYFNIVKKVFPDIVKGDTVVYNEVVLEVCFTEADILGLSYAYYHEYL